MVKTFTASDAQTSFLHPEPRAADVIVEASANPHSNAATAHAGIDVASTITTGDRDLPAGGRSVTAEDDGDDEPDLDKLDDIPDFARDVEDPSPSGSPGHWTGPEELDGPDIQEDVHYPDPAASVPAATVATIAAKLGVPPPSEVAAGRLDLSEDQLSSLREGAVVRVHAPLDAVTWSPLALGRADRVPPPLVEQRARELAAMGQVKPCRARLLPDGTVELVTGMAEWLAAKHIADTAGLVGTVVIDLELLDDAAAHKIVYADMAEGVKVAPIDLARWAKTAIKETFVSQRALAKALGIDEANVTRLLHVGEALDILGDVITDEWAVSRNQAGRFMLIWADKAQRPEIRKFINALPHASAAKTFRAIFDRFEDAPVKRSGEVDVVGDDDQILGRVRPTRAGAVVIQLAKEAGAIELPALVGFVEAALAQVRANAA